MIYGQNKYRSFNRSMISRFFIFLIVFILFENVYGKKDKFVSKTLKLGLRNGRKNFGQLKKEKNPLEEMNKKLETLTSTLQENQCWTNIRLRYIENKIYWIEDSSSVHNYTLGGGWTFGNYNRRSVISTISLSSLLS